MPAAVPSALPPATPRYVVPDFDVLAGKARNLVTPDRHIILHLAQDEPLLARRIDARLTPIAASGLDSAGVLGSVYLTDRRLLHLSADTRGHEITIELGDVTELSLSGEHLLITLKPARGIILDIESVVDFRAQMALAISARRSRWPASGPPRRYIPSR